MKKVLFIDRDGTLIIEPPVDMQVDSLEKLEFYPGVFRYLSMIAEELDYEFVMITNQDGLGTNTFPEETFWPAHNKMIKALANEGIKFSDVLIDRSFPHENMPTRKPGIGMLKQYLTEAYDLRHSFVIGDRDTDVQLAKNLGAKAIYMGSSEYCDTVLSTANWRDVYHYLKQRPRTANVTRKTSETSVTVEVSLDGTGKYSIDTGLGFFDHMLEQVAKHSSINLSVSANGDLHIDEHHTIEDVGIALGRAVKRALGSKKGLQRYGFLLPMDDCLAQVAIDLGGRSMLVWDAEFLRERIGELPTEMLKHFFRSFCDAAECNLNIKAQGENEHHKAEAIFKGFARALKMSIAKTCGYAIPSTKGIL